MAKIETTASSHPLTLQTQLPPPILSMDTVSGEWGLNSDSLSAQWGQSFEKYTVSLIAVVFHTSFLFLWFLNEL